MSGYLYRGLPKLEQVNAAIMAARSADARGPALGAAEDWDEAERRRRETARRREQRRRAREADEIRKATVAIMEGLAGQ